MEDSLFFCLEAKEPKVQDLETRAKNLKNSLKSPKLGRKHILVVEQNFAATQTMEIS